jgi:large subunit ribosomal protein L23
MQLQPGQVIIEPIVTEKSNQLREVNKYVFRVDGRANKIEVMQAVSKLFGVHPVKCNIAAVKRKPKRVRYKLGYTSGWKKAVVTLRPGEVIQVFEGA